MMDGPLHDLMTLWTAGMRAVDRSAERWGRPAPEVWLVGERGRWVLPLGAFTGDSGAPCLGRTLHKALATPGVLRLMVVAAHEDVHRHTLATVFEPYEGCGQPRWFCATRNLAWPWWRQEHGVGHPGSPWLELLSPSRSGVPLDFTLAPPAPPALERVRSLAPRPVPTDPTRALRFLVTLLLPWVDHRPAMAWLVRMETHTLTLDVAPNASVAAQVAELWREAGARPAAVVGIAEVHETGLVDLVVECVGQRATARARLPRGDRSASVVLGPTHPAPCNRAWTA